MLTRSQSHNNFPQQEASPIIVEPLRIELSFLEDQFQEDPPVDPPEVPMADNRIMAKLLQAPIEGYEDAIVIPEIAVYNFELKHVSELKDLVRALLLDKKTNPQLQLHLPLLPQLKQLSRIVSLAVALTHTKIVPLQAETFIKTISKSMCHKPPQQITIKETLVSDLKWLQIKCELLVFLPIKIIKIISIEGTISIKTEEVNQPPAYQAPAYQAPILQTQSVTQTDFVSYIKANDAVLRNMQSQGQNVQNQCQGLQTQIANLTDMLSKFVSSNTASSSGSGTLPSITVTNLKEDLKGITTRSGVAYQGPTIPTQSKVVKQGTEVTKDQVQTPSSQSTATIQPPVIQSKTQTPVSEPVVAPVSVPIPYPSRRDNERRRDHANEQIEKFYEIFKEMSFEISFTDALILMPKFASTLKALIGNKEKLSEMARTPMNEHCSTEGISLPELTPTYMTLELTDRSVSKPIGIAKDVSVKVGVFHFPADFVVVDFEPDPRVSLILRRRFLKTGRALIDVYKGKLTLRIRNKAITYNLDQTMRYSTNYNQMTTNKIDVIFEIYSQEVLGFSDVIASYNPTPYDDLIVSTTSPTLTPFGDIDFLLFEEADAFLSLEDDPDSPKINPFYYDPEGDILLFEAILNSEPLPPLLNHKRYMPSYKKELKVCEAKTVKSSVDEPPEVELKDLPPYIEYAFLEGDNKFPVVIAKELGNEKKSALIKVLKSHKRAIAWKLSDIQVHCVPKKGGFTVIENEENELIPTRLVTGWRVCIDYQKLNEATRKDHFPLPFMDQMLERLAGNEYYCFLDGFSG
nr:reverse transcriptase domain-containing protein [Tanacetum cinerariifolium]